ncbi:hypothetical protein MRX96_001708 [Rhipicephalus microplus]
METAEAAEEDKAEKKPATEVAKKEDDAAEPMEQGDEAEESENKVKTPAAVEPESQDAAKPAEKEKGAAFSSPVKSGSDKPGAEAHSPEKSCV